MNRDVAIVGVAQTRFAPTRADVTFNELVYEVVAQLLSETGVKMSEIRSAVTASQDFFDGKTISSMSVNEVVGGYLQSEAKVAADGILALQYGVARILSGEYDFTLVVAHCMESTVAFHAATHVMFDPFVQRPLGFDDTFAAALQARRYMAVTGATEQDLARISQRAHRDARRNPYAQRSGDFTLDEILSSKVVADPLRELLVAPQCDGACAVLLASAAKAKSFGPRAVWVTGVANCTDAYWTDRELAESFALREAADRAYRMAGIRNPHADIQVAEISARYAHEVPLYAQTLGLNGEDEESAGLRKSFLDLDGGVPINPSGGALTGYPYGVAGLVRVAECYLQLTDSAGERQVPGAATALAHGASGICGQNQCVVILQRNISRL